MTKTKTYKKTKTHRQRQRQIQSASKTQCMLNFWKAGGFKDNKYGISSKNDSTENFPPKLFHQNGHWNKDFISISLPQPPNATWNPLWKIENALFWQDRKLVCNMKCRWNKTRFIILSHDNWASVTQCCVSMFFGTAQQKTYCSQLWLTYKQSFTNILQNIIKQLNMAALLYRWQIHQKSWHRFDIPSLDALNG